MRKRFYPRCYLTLALFFPSLIPATYASALDLLERREGAIIRGPQSEKMITLVFTGHEFAEGGDAILSGLKRHHAKASFFFTGDFLENPEHKSLVERILKDGHYVGPHSDKHLLYCPWDGPKRTLVSRDEFRRDLESNLLKLERYGVHREHVRYFLPPFEHYNEEIAKWSDEMGLTLINYTPGTRSNADYTGENDKNFVSSKAVLKSIFNRERTQPDGLNGFILLLHIGSGPGRKDKFHSRFGELTNRLVADGYRFVRIDELLGETKNGK